ncbi:MAG: tryptophan--tRNA ligase, partial [Psychrobacter sp.]
MSNNSTPDNQTSDTSTEAKRILTGIKPTGIPHLGNYVGAIRP